MAGTLDEGFNPVLGDSDAAFAVAVQPNGHIIVGGAITTVNGMPRSNLFRLLPDGTLETQATFNPGTGPNNTVGSVVVQPDGKILIGGTFTAVNGQMRNRIARLHSDGTLEDTATFNVGFGNEFSQVNSISVQPDGKILIGGLFSTVNEQPRNNVARLLADGSLEPLGSFNIGTGAGSFVRALGVQEDGRILITGGFAQVNGQPRQRVARLLPNGAVDPGFPSPLSSSDSVVNIVADPNGNLFLGGRFPTENLGGSVVYGIGRTGSAGSPLTRLLPNKGVESLALQADGKLVLGGNWGSLPSRGIARLGSDGTVENTATFDATLNFGGEANSLGVSVDGRIIVGGFFSQVNGQPRKSLARLLNDPAVQTLSITGGGTAVQWLRGGAAAEVSLVTFERSIDNGQSWTMLGRGTRIAGGWQLTGLTLPADAAIRARGRTGDGRSTGIVEQMINIPEIALESPAGTRLMDGKTTLDFGPVTAGTTATKTITLRNPGTVPVQNIVVFIAAGGNAGDYAVTQPAGMTLAAGATTTFDVMFTPGAAGDRTATLQIGSNDLDENPFDFNLTGTQATASEAWRQEHFGSPYNTGAGADLNDADRDGLVNLIEFATGSDPLAPTPSMGQLVKNGNNLEFTYTRPKAALTEVSYVREFSETLTGTWSVVGGTVETILSDDGVLQQVKTTVPAGSIGKRFVRLRVTRL